MNETILVNATAGLDVFTPSPPSILMRDFFGWAAGYWWVAVLAVVVIYLAATRPSF
ncbi:MAG: hypothetical protein V1787_05135 [Candidatus Micrarchaeota archaeon]